MIATAFARGAQRKGGWTAGKREKHFPPLPRPSVAFRRWCAVRRGRQTSNYIPCSVDHRTSAVDAGAGSNVAVGVVRPLPARESPTGFLLRATLVNDILMNMYVRPIKGCRRRRQREQLTPVLLQSGAWFSLLHCSPFSLHLPLHLAFRRRLIKLEHQNRGHSLGQFGSRRESYQSNNLALANANGRGAVNSPGGKKRDT